jgi:hypothetical protein
MPLCGPLCGGKPRPDPCDVATFGGGRLTSDPATASTLGRLGASLPLADAAPGADAALVQPGCDGA